MVMFRISSMIARWRNRKVDLGSPTKVDQSTSSTPKSQSPLDIDPLLDFATMLTEVLQSIQLEDIYKVNLGTRSNKKEEDKNKSDKGKEKMPENEEENKEKKTDFAAPQGKELEMLQTQFELHKDKILKPLSNLARTNDKSSADKWLTFAKVTKEILIHNQETNPLTNTVLRILKIIFKIHENNIGITLDNLNQQESEADFFNQIYADLDLIIIHSRFRKLMEKNSQLANSVKSELFSDDKMKMSTQQFYDELVSYLLKKMSNLPLPIDDAAIVEYFLPAIKYVYELPSEALERIFPTLEQELLFKLKAMKLSLLNKLSKQKNPTDITQIANIDENNISQYCEYGVEQICKLGNRDNASLSDNEKMILTHAYRFINLLNNHQEKRRALIFILGSSGDKEKIEISKIISIEYESVQQQINNATATLKRTYLENLKERLSENLNGLIIYIKELINSQKEFILHLVKGGPDWEYTNNLLEKLNNIKKHLTNLNDGINISSSDITLKWYETYTKKIEEQLIALNTLKQDAKANGKRLSNDFLLNTAHQRTENALLGQLYQINNVLNGQKNAYGLLPTPDTSEILDNIRLTASRYQSSQLLTKYIADRKSSVLKNLKYGMVDLWHWWRNRNDERNNFSKASRIDTATTAIDCLKYGKNIKETETKKIDYLLLIKSLIEKHDAIVDPNSEEKQILANILSQMYHDLSDTKDDSIVNRKKAIAELIQFHFISRLRLNLSVVLAKASQVDQIKLYQAERSSFMAGPMESIFRKAWYKFQDILVLDAYRQESEAQYKHIKTLNLYLEQFSEYAAVDNIQNFWIGYTEHCAVAILNVQKTDPDLANKITNNQLFVVETFLKGKVNSPEDIHRIKVAILRHSLPTQLKEILPYETIESIQAKQEAQYGAAQIITTATESEIRKQSAVTSVTNYLTRDLQIYFAGERAAASGRLAYAKTVGGFLADTVGNVGKMANNVVPGAGIAGDVLAGVINYEESNKIKKEVKNACSSDNVITHVQIDHFIGSMAKALVAMYAYQIPLIDTRDIEDFAKYLFERATKAIKTGILNGKTLEATIDSIIIAIYEDCSMKLGGTNVSVNRFHPQHETYKNNNYIITIEEIKPGIAVIDAANNKITYYTRPRAEPEKYGFVFMNKKPEREYLVLANLNDEKIANMIRSEAHQEAIVRAKTELASVSSSKNEDEVASLKQQVDTLTKENAALAVRMQEQEERKRQRKQEKIAYKEQKQLEKGQHQKQKQEALESLVAAQVAVQLENRKKKKNTANPQVIAIQEANSSIKDEVVATTEVVEIPKAVETPKVVGEIDHMQRNLEKTIAIIQDSSVALDQNYKNAQEAIKEELQKTKKDLQEQHQNGGTPLTFFPPVKDIPTLVLEPEEPGKEKLFDNTSQPVKQSA